MESDRPSKRRKTEPAQGGDVGRLIDIEIGSTAKILLSLYTDAMQRENPTIKIPSDDPMLKRFTALDAKTAQAMNLVTAPDRIGESREYMNANLAKIGEAARQRGQQSAVMADAHSMYKKQYDDLVVRVQSTDVQKDDLLKRYKHLVHEQHEAAYELFLRKGNVSVEDIERVLASFEKDVLRFVKDRMQLESDFDKAESQTKNLVGAVSQAGVEPPKLT